MVNIYEHRGSAWRACGRSKIVSLTNRRLIESRIFSNLFLALIVRLEKRRTTVYSEVTEVRNKYQAAIERGDNSLCLNFMTKRNQRRGTERKKIRLPSSASGHHVPQACVISSLYRTASIVCARYTVIHRLTKRDIYLRSQRFLKSASVSAASHIYALKLSLYLFNRSCTSILHALKRWNK